MGGMYYFTLISENIIKTTIFFLEPWENGESIIMGIADI